MLKNVCIVTTIAELLRVCLPEVHFKDLVFFILTCAFWNSWTLTDTQFLKYFFYQVNLFPPREAGALKFAEPEGLNLGIMNNT